MVECSKVSVKLSDTQLKKLKNAAKDKAGTTLRISLKMFDGNHLPHELLLTTRQKTRLRLYKLTDYTNLLSPHDFKKNDNIILFYFKNK